MFSLDLGPSLMTLNVAAALSLGLFSMRLASRSTASRAVFATAVSELRSREEQAVSARMTKYRFLADMSHDLRTPINAVIGYSEMLCEDLTASGRDSFELSKVHELGQLLLSHTNDILDLAKIELGRLPVFSERITLSDLVSEFNSHLLVEEPARIVEIDVRKFRQILRHILSAVNDVVENARIEIRITCNHRRLVCAVLASGDEDALPALRDLFYGHQPLGGRSDRWRNARLGMAFSRQLSAVLGGHVSLTEKANEAGFVIVVPLAPLGQLCPAPPSLSGTPRNIAREV